MTLTIGVDLLADLEKCRLPVAVQQRKGLTRFSISRTQGVN
jgi:hypothetical protein